MNKTIEKIVSLCKQRGFVYQSSDIYGGFGAVYDYGPLGVELKNNIANLWWKEMTSCLLYTSPSPRDLSTSRMPSSA